MWSKRGERLLTFPPKKEKIINNDERGRIRCVICDT